MRMLYDLLIKNVRIVRPTGNVVHPGDIAIRAGKLIIHGLGSAWRSEPPQWRCGLVNAREPHPVAPDHGRADHLLSECRDRAGVQAED